MAWKLIFSCYIIISMVKFTYGWPNKSARNVQETCSNNICNSPGCVSAAHTLIQNMDVSVDPCDDFYQYACGGYTKRVRIPDNQSSRSQFAIMDDELMEQLRDILEANETADTNATVFNLARDQYMSCMDLQRMEEIGLKPIQDLIKKFGTWPVLEDTWKESNFTWHETIPMFRKHGFGTNYLVSFSISTDIRNSSYRTIYIDQPNLGMSREYLIKGFEEENVGHYFSYMQKVAVLLGADPQRAANELEESLIFEMKLANASMAREERRNVSALYHPMTLDELNQHFPLIDWTCYINNILTPELLQVNGSERVVVVAPGYLKNLTDILAKEPKRNVANYMFWRVVKASIGHLNNEARTIVAEYSRNITGQTERSPRWRSCVGNALNTFSAAIGKLYVIQHFKEDAKESMLEMVDNIKEEFRRILDEITWMDCRTKARAYQKLRTIKDYIGYPDEILDNEKLNELYQGLTVNRSEYFSNILNMSIWITNNYWSKLREKVDKTDWKSHAEPAVVNAFYSSIENSIQFPAGILQGIFFNKDRPNYMNYGGIGWVIGHEITHGFDDRGRQFDKDGNLADWWEPETVSKFLDKAQCIINQYGNYTAQEVNLNLNGINTQGENIADNGGLKEAYRAYERWVKRYGEEQLLPGLNLSQKQLFWLSAANVWCVKYRPKNLEYRIRTGVHSPGMFRVKGPFSNSRDFAADFNCPLGSNFNPDHKCEVW